MIRALAKGAGDLRSRRQVVRFAAAAVLSILVMAAAFADGALSGVVVVDVPYILRNATASRAVQDMIEEQRTIYAREISEQELALRKAERDLSQMRNALPPDDFERHRRDLNQRVVDIQRAVQQRRQDLDKTLNNEMRLVRRALFKIIEEIAAEQGAAVVLSKRQVLQIDPRLDITQRVLTTLNKRLPTVDPGPAPAPAAVLP